jgi:choline dehydrogenase-like flavoprotein
MSETQLRVVEAFCDTLVPAVAAGGDDAGDFLARSASDLGIPALVAEGEPPAELLAELAARDFAARSLEERTRVLRELGAESRWRQPLRELRGAVLALFYALPDQHGRNANWEAIGYPGPISAPPPPEVAPKTIPVERVSGRAATLEADVCVVGSGAGGSVVAAELQQAGHRVVVLERGSYRNEADFRQLELVGGRELYLNGGVFYSEGGTVGLLAGSTLGGGTVVNSLVCLRPPRSIREQWARAGLDGLDGSDFDRHLDAVWERLSVNTDATVPNASNQLMIEALRARGLSHELIPRNASLDDDPRFCGYCNAGCQQGCKRSTLVTYLQDAADAGARFVVDCRTERVLTGRGHAVGVVATVGGETELTVKAPTVVVAAGGIESPALLLRSRLGGPAAGKYLRVHPTWFVTGIHPQELHAWSGQIQSVVSFDFADAVDGGGFLCECVILSPSFWAAASPWHDGRQHKLEMLKLRRAASWHAVSHDHGSGEVVLGPDGGALVRWEPDEVDTRIAARAHVELARLHRAAGAEEIYSFHAEGLRWRAGEDFEAFERELAASSYRSLAYSAHQMGSCRMGSDPATAVADGRGELHDAKGVWIGDASALPTAPGVNPMITIMALARRTAGHLAASLES